MRPTEGEYGDGEADSGSLPGHGIEGLGLGLPTDDVEADPQEWLPTISVAREPTVEAEEFDHWTTESEENGEQLHEESLPDELWPEAPSDHSAPGEPGPQAYEFAFDDLAEPSVASVSEPDSEEDLPDPLELFARLQEETSGALEGALAQQPSEVDSEELPDPLELFQRLQGETAAAFEAPRTEHEEAEDEEDLPDPLELFERLQGETAAAFETPRTEDEEDLPDPLELFARLQQQQAEISPDSEPTNESEDFRFEANRDPGQVPHQVGSEALEWEEFEQELPDPLTLFEQMQRMSLEQMEPEQPEEPGELEADPTAPEGLPDARALYEQLELEEPLEAPAFSRREPPGGVEVSSELPPSLPDPKALYEQMESEEDGGDEAPDEPAAVGFFGRIRQALFGDRSDSHKGASPPEPAPLPDPVELYRQLEEEEAEPSEPLESTGPFAAPRIAASGWAPVLSELPIEPGPTEAGERAETLPTPEELFRAIEEEYAQEGKLPELPDLEAFKAELEAEERARLDPDLLEDLSGPERFVETVSDFDFEAVTLFDEPLAEFEAGPVSPPPEAPTIDRPAARDVLREIARSSREKPPEQPPLAPPRLEGPGDGPVLGAPVKTDQRGSGGTVKVDFTSDDYENPPTLLGRSEPSILSRSYQPTTGERRSRGRPGTQAIMTEQRASAALGTAAGGGFARRFLRRRLVFDRQSLSIFTRQLGAMLNAGIPLHLALAFCAESDPEMAPILTSLVEKIESGYSLSGALGEYPDSFDPVYIGLVQTGELSGRLNEMLARLADVLERELELKKRMMSVVTYPAMLMAVSMLGTLGFLFFVLPQITPLFADLGVELPLPTRILLATKDLLGPGLAGLGVLALAYWGARKKIASFVNSKPVLKRRLSSVPFRIPILGGVYEKVITARVLYALSTMLDVGVTMNQALARSETAAGNAFIANRLKGARMDLAEGVPVSECFRNHRVFPDTALHLISAGEEAARLSEMFAYVAEHFDEEVGYALDSAASMLEPAIMVIMGAVVGFIVVAAALPTIHLLQNFS